VPGDGAPHVYTVLARAGACGVQVAGSDAVAADASVIPPEAVIVQVEPIDPCVADGVRVTFTHAGFAGSGRIDAVIDDVVALAGVVSPFDLPLSPGRHVLELRAVDLACASGSLSVPVEVEDRQALAGAPVLMAVEDPACEPGRLRVRFTPASADHHELWRDGARFVSPVVDGATFHAGDALAHSYVVRAVDVACGLQLDSNALDAADVASPCVPGDAVLTVERGGAGVRLRWTEAPDATSYDAYLGTLASVGAGVYDHVPERPGVTFPDAANPARGCDAGAADGLTTRIEPLPMGDAYFIVASRSFDGTPGSHGRRSLAPYERRDPANDPRPANELCP
jgi:hypothetical protein